MSGFLFEQIIFGPIRSRRLGISLGVNLLPLNKKVCTFNCVYCECGWTHSSAVKEQRIPSTQEVLECLEQKLAGMQVKQAMLTTITFAGNGEPTLHPDFQAIIDGSIVLRDKYYPQAKIAVLSNGSTAGKKEVANALMRVDQNIHKLDTGTNESFQRINNPNINISLDQIIENLKQFNGKLIVQTLFVKGTIDGKAFNNTTEEELGPWLRHIALLQPEYVMIYPIARATPTEGVEKVSSETLMEIATRVEALGVPAEVYG